MRHGMFDMNIGQILVMAVILVISISLHEYMHAYVSNRLGDPTPRLQGRLTPNPLKHIDPIGFLMLFLIGFGRGRPVQINPTYYKHYFKGELMVALAGPAANIVLAILAILISLIYGRITGIPLMDIVNQGGDLIVSFWSMFAFINIILAVFNLLPIPPLDGFSIVKVFLPRVGLWVEQYRSYVLIIFLIIILGPGRNVIGTIINRVSSTLFGALFTIFGQLLY